MLTLALLTVAPRAWAVQPAAAGGEAAPADAAAEKLPEDYSCMFCHGAEGTLAGAEETKHLIVTEQDLLADVHWQKGLRCTDCHGGNAVLEDFVVHRDDESFHRIVTPADMPGFCGNCHSDTDYMRRYRPSPRTDQVMEYWTSGHGHKLRKAEEEYQAALKNLPAGDPPPEFKDPQVANCISCHSPGGKHHILAVDDLVSPVYPTNVAMTCSKCHSNAQLMAGRTYHDRPLGHNQYEQWKQSVHGQAMLVKGDLSAPTCNDCHGNHGALPPEVGSVANACGTCHGKVAALFATTRMKHQFETAGLPGCATCHGSHEILAPTDEMLGMTEGAACVRCHQDNKFGATLAGAATARTLRADLEDLKQQIVDAETEVAAAERLGMEVRGPRYDLRKAHAALTNARTQIHTFAPGPVEEALAEGLKVTSEVRSSAEAALAEHKYRRVWLAWSLVPIFIVVVLLLLYIRSMPQTVKPSGTTAVD
jgi:predicted CXXCH cytochrome family protein